MLGVRSSADSRARLADPRSSSCAITYHLAKHQRVQLKLQQELDAALGDDDDAVASFEAVKRLPYLEAVIDEALRVHATSGIGLPRIVPAGGMTVCGRFFPEGAVLSVPTYTIHRDTDVWGEDAEAFRPERWFEQDKAAMQKTFNPFSFGPRWVVPPCPRARGRAERVADVHGQELRRPELGQPGAPCHCSVNLPALSLRPGRPRKGSAFLSTVILQLYRRFDRD